jgi:GntR family transcriptional regulator
MSFHSNGLVLDRESPIPLYYQLASAIRERIQAGVLAAGDQLPAERDLAKEAGISRMTARQALADLAFSGDVIVRHGVGTFVAAPKLTHDALHLLGFTEEMERLGGAVSSRVLECAVVTPPAAIAAALALADDERTVRVVRLRSAGETPLLLETSYVPAAQCPGLEREDLERQSLYSLLELRYGHHLQAARQTIEAAVARSYESALLGVDEGASMLVLEGVTTTDGGWPIEWFKAIYRADRVKIAIESQRESRMVSESMVPLSVMLT